MTKEKCKDPEQPGILRIIHSLLASFFGVQSKRNMARDEKYIEKHGIKLYVITGFLLVFCLVLCLLVLVQIIVHFAT